MLSAEAADDPHAAHRMASANHDHGATNLTDESAADGCADECLCQGHCATSASCAIPADSGPRAASYVAEAPERARSPAHLGVQPARHLRPPIEA